MNDWKPEFINTVHNPSVGKIDMYLMNDGRTGETMISIGVPHGNAETPYMIANAVNAWRNRHTSPMHGPRCPCTNCT